jgi:hypothetical protein
MKKIKNEENFEVFGFWGLLFLIWAELKERPI